MKLKRVLIMAFALCFMFTLLCFADNVNPPMPGDNAFGGETGISVGNPSGWDEILDESNTESDSNSSSGNKSTSGKNSTSGTTGFGSPSTSTADAVNVVAMPFLDVASDAYYAVAVTWAYNHVPQVTAGVTATRFDPKATCTRAQMVTFLWRAEGCPEPNGTVGTFSDVEIGSWYEKAVVWAVENNITNGTGNGMFSPDVVVNRAQAMTFLYRAKGRPAATATESFSDIASGDYYADAVSWAVANNITNGVGNGTFDPYNNCVRSQTVTFLYRAYK